MCKGLRISIILVGLIFILSSYLFAEEQITITTYYPSPYGSYRDLEVLGDLLVYESSIDNREAGRFRFVGNYFGGTNLDAFVIEKVDDDRRVEGGIAFVFTTSNGTDVPRQDSRWAQGGSLNAMVIRGVNSGGVLTGANVGIGTTTPDYSLHVSDARATSPAIGVIAIDGYGTLGGNLLLRQAEGWQGALLSSTTTDNLGIIGFRGCTGSAFSATNGAMIQAWPAEPWSVGNQGTNLAFSTTPVGTATPQTAVVISENGNVGIGTTAPVGRLHVVGPNDATSVVTFMPGSNTAAAGTPSLNVGIGTTTPQAALDMGAGGIRLGGVTRTTWPASQTTVAYGASSCGSSWRYSYATCPAGYERTGCSGYLNYACWGNVACDYLGSRPSGSRGCTAIALGRNNDSCVTSYAYCLRTN